METEIRQKLPSDLDAHISHFTTKRLKSRKQSVIGVVAIMFTKTLKGTKSERRNKNTRNTVLSSKKKKTNSKSAQERRRGTLRILYFLFYSACFCVFFFLKRESCTNTQQTTLRQSIKKNRLKKKQKTKNIKPLYAKTMRWSQSFCVSARLPFAIWLGVKVELRPRSILWPISRAE